METLFWLEPSMDLLQIILGLSAFAFLLCAVVVVLAPFANIKQTYKSVLLYRGINSVLVDKTVNTAEKALDVLNVKLDEMIKNQTPEKECDELTENQKIEKEALLRKLRDSFDDLIKQRNLWIQKNKAAEKEGK